MYVVVIYGGTSADLNFTSVCGIALLHSNYFCTNTIIVPHLKNGKTTMSIRPSCCTVSLCLCLNITFCYPRSLQIPRTHNLHDRRRLWRQNVEQPSQLTALAISLLIPSPITKRRSIERQAMQAVRQACLATLESLILAFMCSCKCRMIPQIRCGSPLTT